MATVLDSFFVPLVVLGVALAMMVAEATAPGRKWPTVSGWYARAIALNLCQAGAIVLAGVTWDPWLKEHRLWNMDGLGVTAGAFLGYFVQSFVYYWWHRGRHEVGFLWRWFHQVHHSPQRLTVITSFYKHPFELLMNGIISSVLLYTVMGFGPQAVGYTLLISGLAELFYHWNVRTPHWLGYVFQRPESHCVHHQKGVHHYNFSDLPLWDWMFGTLLNPKSFDYECGFGDANEHRLGEMLMGVDVNAEPAKVTS